MKNKNRTIDVEPDSGVDLTPMLDVVFILLIFFIVTASFVKEFTLPSGVGNSDTPKGKNSSAMVVYIDSDNKISFDGRVVDQQSVRSLLLSNLTEETQQLVINAHENAKVETYVAVSNAARQAHRSEIALSVVKDERIVF